MLEGLYSAAAGMEAQQVQLDAVANDLSNANTPGYQSTQVGFRELLYGRDNGSSAAVGAGAAASTIGYDQTEGQIHQTGNPLDVAIQGQGYLEVRQANGTTGLTRNGTLQLDAAGRLTTDQGLPLVPPVTVPKGTSPGSITIRPDGTVQAGSTKVGKITVVTVPAPDQLAEAGGGVFSPTAATGAIRPATGATLQQGALEQSNIDMNAEMTTMMAAQESYSLASKAINVEEQLGQIASTLKTA